MRAGWSNQNPRDRTEPVSERNGFQLQTLVFGLPSSSVLSGMLLRKRFSSWVCSLAVPHTSVTWESCSVMFFFLVCHVTNWSVVYLLHMVAVRVRKRRCLSPSFCCVNFLSSLVTLSLCYIFT